MRKLQYWYSIDNLILGDGYLCCIFINSSRYQTDVYLRYFKSKCWNISWVCPVSFRGTPRFNIDIIQKVLKLGDWKSKQWRRTKESTYISPSSVHWTTASPIFKKSLIFWGFESQVQIWRISWLKYLFFYHVILSRYTCHNKKVWIQGCIRNPLLLL